MPADPPPRSAAWTDVALAARIASSSVPWVVFSAAATRSSLTTAALLGVLASLAFCLPSFAVGRTKALDAGNLLAFLGLLIVAPTLPGGVASTVGHFGLALGAEVLAFTALVSAVYMPFTEQYAHVAGTLPSATRRRAHRRQSERWSVAFALMVPSHLSAALTHAPEVAAAFDVAVPVALVAWASLPVVDLRRETSPARCLVPGAAPTHPHP